MHWCTLRTRPSSAGVGGDATLHGTERVGVGVVPFRRGELDMSLLYAMDQQYTRAYIKMQEPRLSRTLHALAVHSGTPTGL